MNLKTGVVEKIGGGGGGPSFVAFANETFSWGGVDCFCFLGGVVQAAGGLLAGLPSSIVLDFVGVTGVAGVEGG